MNGQIQKYGVRRYGRSKTNGATAGVAIAQARMTLSQDTVLRLGQILEALVALGHTSVSRTGMDNQQSLSNDIYTHGRTHHPGETS